MRTDDALQTLRELEGVRARVRVNARPLWRILATLAGMFACFDVIEIVAVVRGDAGPAGAGGVAYAAGIVAVVVLGSVLLNLWFHRVGKLFGGFGAADGYWKFIGFIGLLTIPLAFVPKLYIGPCLALSAGYYLVGRWFRLRSLRLIMPALFFAAILLRAVMPSSFGVLLSLVHALGFGIAAWCAYRAARAGGAMPGHP